MKKLVLLGCLPVLAAGIIGGWIIAHRVAPSEFRRATRNISAFNPYYFPGSPPDDFQFDDSSLHYQNGVLVFSLKNTQDRLKTLAFTEQRTPSNYNISSLQGDKEFKTFYGQAFILDGSLRTTGTLFTDDHTWVLINAPSPVGIGTMQTILESLQPSK